MIHKIWDKDTSDSESGSIRDHLISCFHSIHMDPTSFSGTKEDSICEGLIRLASCMDLAQLTSLEQLIYVMEVLKKIPEKLSDSLWAIFGNFFMLISSHEGCKGVFK